MEKFILAIDQSTSGTKSLVVGQDGSVIARSSAEHRQHYPAPGWVEHDPIEIYENVKKTAGQALKLAGIEPGRLAAVTITNQRETALIWDKTTGEPVYNAIVWQCQRTADACEALKAGGYEQIVHAKTGLMLDPYFSAAKWGWILEQVPAAEAEVERRQAARRHCRQLAALEADGREGTRHGLHEREPHLPV